MAVLLSLDYFISQRPVYVHVFIPPQRLGVLFGRIVAQPEIKAEWRRLRSAVYHSGTLTFPYVAIIRDGWSVKTISERQLESSSSEGEPCLGICLDAVHVLRPRVGRGGGQCRGCSH